MRFMHTPLDEEKMEKIAAKTWNIEMVTERCDNIAREEAQRAANLKR